MHLGGLRRPVQFEIQCHGYSQMHKICRFRVHVEVKIAPITLISSAESEVEVLHVCKLTMPSEGEEPARFPNSFLASQPFCLRYTAETSSQHLAE